MSAHTPATAVCYSGSHHHARWHGYHVADAQQFTDFLRSAVAPRVADAESGFEQHLRGLATTGMATDQVEKLLKAVPASTGWEIGEAWAECTLASGLGRHVHWPWNTVRDRRAPRASLPGTDLVGFCVSGNDAWLIFGEVKTSSDAGTPPNVMYGGSGMAWQLEASAKKLDLQHTLLQWLYPRCRDGASRDYYEKAVGRFIHSQGKDLLVVGVLVRDTTPSDADLRSRGQALASAIPGPTSIELLAWYLPVAIDQWPALISGATP
jgi:hypothetical protein